MSGLCKKKIVISRPAAGGNFGGIYIFDGKIYYFRGPDRSKNKGKQCEGCKKGPKIFGAPNGATNGPKIDTKQL